MVRKFRPDAPARVSCLASLWGGVQNPLIKLLRDGHTATVSTGEYVKTLVAICNAEPTERSKITEKNKPIERLIMDHIVGGNNIGYVYNHIVSYRV